MGSISMARMGIALWFACYVFLAMINYLFTLNGGERLSIFWMIVQATVFMAFIMAVIGFWIDTDEAPAKRS